LETLKNHGVKSSQLIMCLPLNGRLALGAIKSENAASAYAKTGIDMTSLRYLTHFAKISNLNWEMPM
jgi:nicotinate-nucleotide pyrophosphorylase